MPDLPKRPCGYPGGCSEYAIRNGRCESHDWQAVRQKEDYRGTAASRGYDHAWQIFRAWFIRRHPVCADCGIVRTSDVHHAKKVAEFPELRLVESNCMGLCHSCHSIRTKRGE